MTFADLPRRLRVELARSLPGAAARRPFAPELGYGRHEGPPAPNARQAAVLVLLAPQENLQWILPMTVRPEHMHEHAGQVSFPGGALEEGESPEQCALREYQEELGQLPPSLQILGRLSPLYVFASNFVVTPVVASGSARPLYSPNAEEVAQVIELPIADVVDSSSYGSITIRRPGVCFQAPAVCCGQHQIWGATCLMLGELAALLRR